MSSSQCDERQTGSGITSFEPVVLDELESPAVQLGAGYWKRIRGSRRFPARRDLHPRDFKPVLRDMLLIKVVDGGADFEFRIAGDAQVQAHSIPFQGKRLSQIAQIATAYCYGLRGIFSLVIQKGEPFAVRGRVGLDFPKARYAYCESVFLPLGPNDGVVDHILSFGTYVPRALADNPI